MKDHPHFKNPDMPIEYLAGHPSYIAELAKSGYRCALSGKWHLGNQEQPKEGFEKWFTISSGGCPYYAPDFFEDGKFTYSREYVTDAITNRALDYLDDLKQGDAPFCLQVHYTAPHSPWSPENHPAEYLDMYRDCGFTATPDEPVHRNQIWSAPVGDTPEKRRENLAGYYAAITAMDANIGRLLDKLEQDGLAENTVVIFTADNGMNMGHHGVWGKGNGTYPPNMYDSSVKVPFIIRAPFVNKAGAVASKNANHCDLFPTLMDIAGAEYTLTDKQPGMSLLPYLQGDCEDNDSRYVEIHDEYGFVRMIRGERYKLVKRYTDHEDELYDMIADPGEERNLIDDPACAAVVAELNEALEAWFERYSDPVNDGSKAVTLTGSGQRDLCTAPDAFVNQNTMYYTGKKPF